MCTKAWFSWSKKSETAEKKIVFNQKSNCINIQMPFICSLIGAALCSQRADKRISIFSRGGVDGFGQYAEQHEKQSLPPAQYPSNLGYLRL